MEIWNNFVDWLSSGSGQHIVTTIILPFLAIIIAGVIAALVARGALTRVVALSDREDKASAVNALISAARKAAVWNSLPAPEQAHIEHLIGEADIKLRLLPVAGTALAADWTSHEIKDMQKNAVSFSFQAEQSLLAFRDRLIEWQAHPGRAKKLFKNDLDSWAYDSSVSEQDLVAQQQAWAAQQAEARTLDAYKAPTAATRVVTSAETQAQSTQRQASQTIPTAAPEGASPVGQKTYYARTVPTDAASDAAFAPSKSPETTTDDASRTTDRELEARRETTSYAPVASGTSSAHPDEGTTTR